MKATVGRIWEAASVDESRPALAHVWFDAENATLTASDSYVLARVSCEVEEGDESGWIPAAAIKAAGRNSLFVSDGKARLVLKDGERYWRLGDPGWKKPDYDKIFADAQAVEFPIGFNHEYLARLARSIGCHKTNLPTVLHPAASLRGMLVQAGERDDRLGVIMPVRLSSHEWPPRREPAPDLSNPDVVLAASRAAVDALDKRRGKKRAHEAFMRTAIDATVEAAVAAQEAA